MVSTQSQSKTPKEDKDLLLASQLACMSLVPMVVKAAIELNLLEIMAKAGPGKQLSASEIAAQLSTQNLDAPDMLERILRFLASNSILTCSVVSGDDGHVQNLYGLTPVSKYFVPDQDGVSLAPLLLMINDKSYKESWYHLKDAVLEGGIPFNKAHGMPVYKYLGKDPSFNKICNEAMLSISLSIMKSVLEIYEGFDNVNVVVDVGGGLGENLHFITSKYPNIKGINYDLPHVIANAPEYLGVEHVSGDMFLCVPKGDIIFLKTIIHNWSDDHCLRLLKHCYEALPEDGKVVILEAILPESPESNFLEKDIFGMDLCMMVLQYGGKERTQKEYSDLAKASGFNGIRMVCQVHAFSVLEFSKTM
ncbi:caffeic acid 3-O-methyltransferase-like [Macadamia integrifolia]|uniref:caffeic acid 3-O-methyltransferase-like n=1 Tax=Macadamia integrifolia TaxID=60698 RepID=UPI001C4FCFC3|nr:caffeic acid 3-O-methyltransferase-like [Macadamia integrifolia]